MKDFTENVNTPNLRVRKISRKKLVSFYIDTVLLEQAKNSIKSQKALGIFKYRGVSEIIRASLIAFKNKEIDLAPSARIAEFQETSVLLKDDLLDFYNSLPLGNKREIVNRCFASYLLKI